MEKITGDFEELFSEELGDAEFIDHYRRQKPYSDLVIDVVNRRNELEMTQKELAKRAGTYQSRISKIESGEHDFRLSTIINIAEALETEVEIRLKPIGIPDEKYFFHFEPRINIALMGTGFSIPEREETLDTDDTFDDDLLDIPQARWSEPVFAEV